MDVQRVHSLLASRYQGVAETRSRIFKANYSHKQKLVGVYYFDCSKEVMNSDFNLSQYQDELLSEEYYKHPGSIQWNFYLYFVCDDDDYSRLLKTGKANEIEVNRIYAKKFVSSAKQLEEELLRRSRHWQHPSSELPGDISIRWIERLQQEGLDEIIVRDVPRVQVVRRFLESEPKVGTPKIKNGATVITDSLTHIKSIELDNYRPYPEEKAFNFSVANLIEGANGSGKTSLLEAIELWVCGQTFRNPKAGDEDTRIRVKFSGHSPFIWNRSGDNSFYRKRDLAWYGNAYAKGNRLSQGFNRFNFYDSDAAFSLINNSDSKSIYESISSLIFGEAANVIEERLRSVLNIFKQEQSICDKELRSYEAAIKEASDELNMLGLTSEKQEGLFERFINELEKLGWKGLIPRKDEASLTKFLRTLGNLSARVEECRSQLNWLRSISLKSVQDERMRLSEVISNLDELTAQIKECESRNVEIEAEARIQATYVDAVEAWRRYLLEEEAPLLAGLDNAIEEKRREYERVNKIADLIKEIDLAVYLDLQSSISEEEKSAKELLQKNREELKHVRKRMDELTQQNDRLTTLVSEIRARASLIVAEHPSVRDCPLCGAVYEVGMLAKKLEGQLNTFQPWMSLTDDIDKENSLQARLMELERRQAELRNIKLAVSLWLNSTASPRLRLSDAALSLSSANDAVDAAADSLGALIGLRDRLSAKGLTEEEYTSLSNFLKATYGDDLPEYEDKLRFTQFLENEKKHLSDLNLGLAKLRQTGAALNTKKAELIYTAAGNLAVEGEGEFELRKRNKQIVDFLKAYESISEQIEVPSQDSLTSISIRLTEIQKAYERFMQGQKLLRESEYVRERSTSKINDVKPKQADMSRRKHKIDAAVHAISDILDNDSKEHHLRSFFEEYARDIVEIYRMIHAPREFSDIDFGDPAEGQIRLIRQGSGRASLLTQISSGQRSALSLSIFLALNRKLKNGPPYILLDDPLALVDDLNALSFLDYLRDIVITGDRQVFFATANQKVASLFRKKFDSLGDDFAYIPLQRSSVVA